MPHVDAVSESYNSKWFLPTSSGLGIGFANPDPSSDLGRLALNYATPAPFQNVVTRPETARGGISTIIL